MYKKFKYIGSLVIAFTFFNQSFAGDCSKWGPDSARTVRALSIYKVFYKQKNYKDAYPEWRYLFLNAPGSKEYIYIDGASMLGKMIRKEKDAAKKGKMVDTLMMVYDQRIKCFGKEGAVLGRKAIDLATFRSKEVALIFNTFKKAVDKSDSLTQYFILDPYFRYVVKAVKKELITKEEGLNIYQKISQIAGFNVSKGGKYKSKYEDTQEKLGDRFVKTEWIKDCAEAKAMYANKYKEDSGNVGIWKQIFGLMKSINCISDPLFIEVTTKLNEKEPTARMSFFLSKALAASKKFKEAYAMCEKAVSLEEDPKSKAEYLLYEGEVYQRAGDYSTARVKALAAAKLRPNWGAPYMLIGDLYASSGKLCGTGTDFKSHAVSWFAIDMWQKAKSIDPNFTGEANKNILKYAQYMPDSEEIFLKQLKVGDSYTIDCWINRSTTIRARK